MNSSLLSPHVDEARRLFGQGRVADAVTLLSNRIEDPGAAGALREFLVAERRRDEALKVAAVHGGLLDQALVQFFRGDLEAALMLSERALSARQDDPVALLHQARCLHNLGRREAALAVFRRVVALDDAFPEGWHALGHALRASGNLAAAGQAFETAISLSPGLRMAQLDLGITRLNEDDAEGALACFEWLLDQNADDVDALVNAGLALHLGGQTRHAVRRLKRALALVPEHPEAHRFLASIFNQAGEASQAISHLHQALKVMPDDPDLLAELADIHELSSELEAAQKATRRGLEVAPDHPLLNLQDARLARRAGDLEHARSGLERIDAEYMPARQQLQFYQELGQVLDRLDQPGPALAAFAEANRLAGRDARFQAIDRRAYPEKLAAIRRWLSTPEATSGFPPIDRAEDAGRDLVFLIGFTRSGTTLLDTFLKAHPALVTLEEKPTIERLLDEMTTAGTSYPAGLNALTAADWHQLRARYRTLLGSYLPPGQHARIIDRQPLRMIHAVFLRRLFPGARLLLAVRHPADVVLSNFMQNFEPGEALVHCDTLASTVALYDQVMQVWQAQVPLVGNKLTQVRYEDLVADPEKQLMAICLALDIVFDPVMLERDQRVRAAGRVRTSSYQQVHEKIYRRAAGRWERYRDHLAPFLPALAPHVDYFGYSSIESGR